MTTADLYLRKSSADDGHSAADQERADRVDVAEQGWTVGQVFADPDRSASRYAKRGRPGYDALVEHIRRGVCAVLVVWEASRGSRDLTEWSTLLDLCRRHRVKLRVVVDERTYSLAIASDWRALASAGVDSAYESEKISQRTLRGKRTAALDGQPSGPTPYGYARTYGVIRGKSRPATQTEDPTTAPLVREIFDRLAAGATLTGVAADLTARAVPTPGTAPVWRPSTVRALALNRRYLGRSMYHGEDVGPAIWPALVDAETFERVERLLTSPQRRTQRGTELRWVLSGIPRCSLCPGRLITFYGGTAPGTRRYACQKCRRCTMQAEPLDLLIESRVLARLSAPDARDLFVRRVPTAAVKAAKDQLANLRRDLADYEKRAIARTITADSFERISAGLSEQITAAERHIDAMTLPAPLADLAGVDIVTEWPDWPVRRRRGIISATVDLVVRPAIRGRVAFDPTRLDASRWVGDPRTWGELRTA